MARYRTGPEPLETGPGTGTFATGSEPVPNRETVDPSEKNCRNRGTAGKNRLNRTKEPRAGSPTPTVPRNRLRTVNRTGPVEPAQRFHGTGTGTGPGTVRFQRSNGSLEPGQSSRFLVKAVARVLLAQKSNRSRGHPPTFQTPPLVVSLLTQKKARLLAQDAFAPAPQKVSC